MAAIDDEIASQASAWRTARDLAATHSKVLPGPAESIVLVGCGTSWWMATAIAGRRDELRTQGVSDAQAASLFTPSPSRLARYDLLVAISRTGTTTEVVRLIEAVRSARNGDAPRVLAIVEDARTPVGQLGDDTICLPTEGADSIVQTVFATSHYAMWRAHLGEDVDALADALEVDAATSPPELDEYDQVVFLGHGASYGLAQEAALKLREIAGFQSHALPSLEVRHGAAAAFFGLNTMVWALGPQPPDLLADMAAIGVTVIARPNIDPLVELVQVQRAAVNVARRRNRDPGVPPNLTRSVQLSADQ